MIASSASSGRRVRFSSMWNTIVAAGTLSGPLLLCALLIAPPAVAEDRSGAIRFLGHADIPTGYVLDGAEVGGLSGITWLGDDRYLAVSDNSVSPVAFELRIDLSQGRLPRGGVSVTRVLRPLDTDGWPFGMPIDLEGVRAAEDGTIYAADEGLPFYGHSPLIRRFDPEMRALGTIDPPEKVVPDGFRQRPRSTRGARPNRGFEAVSITPDGRWLVTATEQALLQDGPLVSSKNGSRARIFLHNLETDRPGPEYVYDVAPVPSMLDRTPSSETSGLTDLLALDNDGSFLVLERSFTFWDGFEAKLFEVDTREATDVSAAQAIPEDAVPVRKTVLFDISHLPEGDENWEGLAFGPWLDEDTQVLFLVSDNNFRHLQRTRIMALAYDVPQTRLRALGRPIADLTQQTD